MLAVFETGGKQYMVKPGDKIKVEKLKESKGELVFDKVLLRSNDEKSEPEIGRPYIESAKITAKLVRDGKAKKIRVFKMHAKKRYKKLQGHRQRYSEIEITKIS